MVIRMNGWLAIGSLVLLLHHLSEISNLCLSQWMSKACPLEKQGETCEIQSANCKLLYSSKNEISGLCMLNDICHNAR